MLRRATGADAPANAAVLRRTFGTLALLPTPHAAEETGGGCNGEGEPDVRYERRP